MKICRISSYGRMKKIYVRKLTRKKQRKNRNRQSECSQYDFIKPQKKHSILHRALQKDSFIAVLSMLINSI